MAFRKVDTDFSQTVEKEEFAQVLANFHIVLAPAEFDQLWRRYDHDGNGSINYDEFVANFSDEIQAQERGGIGVLMANSAEERQELGIGGRDHALNGEADVSAEAAAIVDGELRRLVKKVRICCRSPCAAPRIFHRADTRSSSSPSPFFLSPARVELEAHEDTICRGRRRPQRRARAQRVQGGARNDGHAARGGAVQPRVAQV